MLGTGVLNQIKLEFITEKVRESLNGSLSHERALHQIASMLAVNPRPLTEKEMAWGIEIANRISKESE